MQPHQPAPAQSAVSAADSTPFKFGIVEGRFGNPPEARFERARQAGFDGVELSFHGQDFESLPLWTHQGAARVRALASEAGVELPSTCATYFNQFALVSDDPGERARHVDVLRRLIGTSATAGLRTILLPFFGNGELKSADERGRAAEAVATCAAQARDAGIRLGIEATLPVAMLRDMVNVAGSPGAVGVYYDVGNVCPAGYNVEADLAALADLLVGIHIKDRRRSGENVQLGEGDVDFGAVVRGLRAVRYTGYLVLETPGPPPGADPLAANQANLQAIRRWVVGELADSG
jgi:L-ribulose-5-phosphate 3-epimerase